MRLVFAVLAATLSCGPFVTPSAEAVHNGAPSTPDALVDRFLANTEPALTSYRAFRVLQAETRGGKMQARLTAWTTLDPVEGFNYSIVDESGSGVVRQKALRAALEAERTLISTGDVRRGAITPHNYEFGGGERDEDGLVRIQLRPKRHDTMLVDGSMLLTEVDGDLTR